MKKIVLCPNPTRDKGLAYTAKVKQMLEENGFATAVSPVYGTADSFMEQTPLDMAVKDASLLVTLGGDGTILKIAPDVMAEQLPIIGVNLGHKGFLAALNPEDTDMLLAAARGEGSVVPRMMVDVTVTRNGRVIFRDTALNDAVITGVTRNVRLTAMDGEARIMSFSGDGIIVCTPTGSTGYCLSAGGPLAEPGAENIILTPICAHDLASRSFVLGPERVVNVCPEQLEDRRCVLSADGRSNVDLRDGDRVTVKKSAYKTLLVHIGEKSFYDTAFEKLGDGR